MNSTSHRHIVDNPQTGDHAPIKRVTSELARADFFFESSRIEVTPSPESTLNSAQQDAGNSPKEASVTIVGIVLILTLAGLAVYYETAGKPEPPKTQTTTEVPAEPPTTSDTQKQ